MVRVMEMSGGHIIIREPGGDVRLDTKTPMPIVLGEDSFSTSFQYPSVPGANSSAWVYNNNSYSATLTAVTGSYSAVDADWLIVNFRARLNNWTFGTASKLSRPMVARIDGSWSPYYNSTGGSALLEVGVDPGDLPWYYRHICIQKSGTDWVIEYRHSNIAISGTLTGLYTGTGWLDSDYDIEGSIRWGRFK